MTISLSCKDTAIAARIRVVSIYTIGHTIVDTMSWEVIW